MIIGKKRLETAVMKKLTIGIPTYNSCNYLKETIDIALDQIKLLDNVELLICDNASSDGTQLLVEEYVKVFPDVIRYIRHQSNLGVDKNFWSVIKHARGEYVHLLADDDYYTKNSIERILDKVSICDFDAILLSNNFLNTLNGKVIRNEESQTEDILCNANGEKFFLCENLKTLCLSNVIVKRLKCLEISDVEKYFGCQWLHIALLTEIIKPISTTYIFNFKEPLVTVRIGNQKWLEKDGAIDFYYKALEVFSNLKNAGYKDSVFENIKKSFIPLILNGGKINFNKTYMNLFYCMKFLKFYYNMPKQYIFFCMLLVFKKHRPFFDGWENIGN